MTDETRAGKATIDAEDGVLGGEAALLHAQDDPAASAAVDAAVEAELLEDAPAHEAVEARRESERQIADLTAQDQQRMRDIQRELRTMGADVWPISRWWGFEIHLNESAALLAADIPQLIGQAAATVVGSWLAPLIERSVRSKAVWIASIARPYGVKLVSPWTAPAMLVPARQDGRPAGGAGLYWAVHEPEEGWAADQRFIDHVSATGPALGQFRDRLYLAHRGRDGDESLWWAVYDAEEGWSGDQRFPQHLSKAAPALAAWDGHLYCVHRGAGDDAALWWTRWDGSRWTPDERLPAHATGANPALAVYRGHLYCVHRGAGDDAALWWTRWDGSQWSPDQRLPGHDAAEGPALAVYKDRLYCVHRGTADQSLWWSSFNGTSWSAAERLPGHFSGEAPAVIAYRDRNATRDQLLCVHRGVR